MCQSAWQVRYLKKLALTLIEDSFPIIDSHSSNAEDKLPLFQSILPLLSIPSQTIVEIKQLRQKL